MHIKSIKVNTVIFGGGIAGLWLLHRLRKQGVDAVLLESDALGAGQTGASQGIIHGGVKYALNGVLNRASQSIADMPGIWQDCLLGYGEVDLSEAKTWSDSQYLWSPKRLGSRLKIFFASQLLRGRCESVAREKMPAPFDAPAFKGQLYRLNESVVDVYSVLEALAKPYQAFVLKAPATHTSIKVSQHKIQGIDVVHGKNVFHLQADNYVMATGEQNEALILHTRVVHSPMQRRPLRMALVTFDGIRPVYAHCFAKGNKPAITITSHKNENDEWVWYVGGEVAEKGAKQSPEKHRACVLKALKKGFPWLDFERLRFDSFMVDRAESWQRDGSRPDLPYVKNFGDVTVVWPTKLAFAPLVANEVIQHLKPSEQPSSGLEYLADWPKAQAAKAIWERV